MVSLRQNLKTEKTCEKPFFKIIRSVKKKLEKTLNIPEMRQIYKLAIFQNTKYSRNETILKIGHLAKAIAHGKAIYFAKWSVGSKSKNANNIRKSIVQDY